MSASRNDQLTQDIRQTARQTEDTLSRVQKTLLDATATANDVTAELHNQGNALRNIDHTLDEVQAEAKHGEKLAKQVNKGFLGWMFSSDPKRPKSATSSSVPEPKQPVQASSRPAATTSHPPAPNAQLNYEELEKTGNTELAQEMRQHDETYNSQLDNISALLDGLTTQAGAIGEELTIQNATLGRLGDKSDHANESIASVNKQLHKFNRK